MKTTLEQRLHEEIYRIDARCLQLWKHRELYKDSNDFASASKCEIEWEQLKTISQSLKELLAN